MYVSLGALVSILLLVGLASADEKKAQSPQAERMTQCNAEAHDKKLTGDARKQFMSDCLRGHSKSHEDEGGKTEQASQQRQSTGGQHSGQGEKMKACNQEATAKSLHGDDRRHFMSQCLKAEKKP
jgi:hypothetical protein